MREYDGRWMPLRGTAGTLVLKRRLPSARAGRTRALCDSQTIHSDQQPLSHNRSDCTFLIFRSVRRLPVHERERILRVDFQRLCVVIRGLLQNALMLKPQCCTLLHFAVLKIVLRRLGVVARSLLHNARQEAPWGARQATYGAAPNSATCATDSLAMHTACSL